MKLHEIITQKLEGAKRDLERMSFFHKGSFADYLETKNRLIGEIQAYTDILILLENNNFEE